MFWYIHMILCVLIYRHPWNLSHSQNKEHIHPPLRNFIMKPPNYFLSQYISFHFLEFYVIVIHHVIFSLPDIFLLEILISSRCWMVLHFTGMPHLSPHTDWHQVCFQFWLLWTELLWTWYMWAFVWMYACSYWGECLEPKWFCMVVCVYTFNTLPDWWYILCLYRQHVRDLTGGKGELLCFHTSSPCWVRSVFLILVFLTGEGCLIVVVICISLMSDGIELPFCHLYFFSGDIAIQIFYLFIRLFWFWVLIEFSYFEHYKYKSFIQYMLHKCFLSICDFILLCLSDSKRFFLTV